MKCKEYLRYLGPYIDSELDAKTCVEITNHLNVCPDCNKRFSQEQEVERLLAGKLKEERMPESMWKEIQADIRAYDLDTSRGGVWSKIDLRWLVPVAATAAVALGLSLFFFWGAPPADNTLALTLQEIHEGYLRDEVTVGETVVWPESYKSMSLPGHLPRSEVVGGHSVELVGGKPYYLNEVELAFLEYRCCGEPVSMLVIRKEDLEHFPQTRDLLESNDGRVKITSGETNLVMVDMGKVVVCCISNHELNALLTAFKRA